MNLTINCSSMTSLTNKKNTLQKTDNGEQQQSVATLYPSFLRLFVLNRIIKSKHYQLYGKEIVDQAMKALKKTKNVPKSSLKMINNLNKHGINEYLQKYYHNNQCHMIEFIFENIFLTKFSDDYNKIITFKTKNNNDKETYQNIVFNFPDVMYYLLSFLEFLDLNVLSKVNSNMLIYAFNPNSTYFVRISDSEICRKEINHKRLCARVLQRIYKTKKIFICNHDSNQTINLAMQLSLPYMTNLEKLLIYTKRKGILIICLSIHFCVTC